MVTQRRWPTAAAAAGLAYWFFGNLYEAVVISPNWVVDSSQQLRRLNEFFTVTTPTLYFVPVTMVATVLVWVAHALNRRADLRAAYRRASMLAVALTGLNLVIVTTVLPHLFGDAGGDPQRWAWTWNVLNGFRMALTAATAITLIGAWDALGRRTHL